MQTKKNTKVSFIFKLQYNCSLDLKHTQILKQIISHTIKMCLDTYVWCSVETREKY